MTAWSPRRYIYLDLAIVVSAIGMLAAAAFAGHAFTEATNGADDIVAALIEHKAQYPIAFALIAILNFIVMTVMVQRKRMQLDKWAYESRYCSMRRIDIVLPGREAISFELSPEEADLCTKLSFDAARNPNSARALDRIRELLHDRATAKFVETGIVK